jgi:thiamine-monophosphate kinase
MKVSELGEFRLIKLLSDIALDEGANRPLLVNVGDDAAAWQSNSSTILATTDTMVQEVHFTTESTWKEIGWKAVAINLSDIAAMGGMPQYALVSLSFPGNTEVDDVTQLYHGITEIAKQFQLAIVGGNLSSAPISVITVTVIGEASSVGILTRSAAMPGDSIAVTGYLGLSAAGLKMLTQVLQFDSQAMTFLRRAHLQPQPRIAEGQMLVQQGVRAAIDISDGLMSDLGHVCNASKVGARLRVDRVPIHPLVRANFPEDALGFAIGGGEDYELLFTAGEEIIERVQRMTECPITVIGEIVRGTPGEMTLIDEEGKLFPWDEKKGWEHFKKPDNH